MAKTETLDGPAAKRATKGHASADRGQDLVAWAKRNMRLIYAAVAVVVIVAAGAWLVVATQQRKEQAGQEALTDARNTLDSQNLPAAAAAFQNVIQTYSGTQAATEATLMLNQLRMVNGQNELAVVGLKEFLASNPDRHYAVPAEGLLGAALENVERPGEAADAYQRAADQAGVDYLTAQYLIDAARAYVAAGQKDQAVQALQRVLDDYSDTPSITEAKVRLAEIEPGQLSDGPKGL